MNIPHCEHTCIFVYIVFFRNVEKSGARIFTVKEYNVVKQKNKIKDKKIHTRYVGLFSKKKDRKNGRKKIKKIPVQDVHIQVEILG